MRVGDMFAPMLFVFIVSPPEYGAVTLLQTDYRPSGGDETSGHSLLKIKA
jgi:hypothetical protein